MLRLLVQLLLAIAWLLSLPLRMLTRFWPLKAGTYVYAEIDGAVREIVEPRKLFDFGQPRPTSLHALHRTIDQVIADPKVAGMIVIVRAFRGGAATATAFRAALGRVRAAGKELVVHLPQGGATKDVYFASVATRLYAGPNAPMAPLGFLSATRYMRRALDKAGLVPEVFAAGKYKSAGEQLARDAMSEPQREQLGALLDTLAGEVVTALSDGRRITRDEARAIIDGGPYLGKDAVAAKVVDGLAYEDELPSKVGGDRGAAPIVFAARFVQKRRALSMRMVTRRPIIGVIRIHGAIASASPPSLRLVPMAIDERVMAAARLARADRNVMGVILHIDSPGGSALASDRMHHELCQLAAEKPVIACMGDVAASGGYYVAMAAQAIVAQPTTVTGSIGVVAARVLARPLFERVGVKTEIVKRGARAHLLDPTLPIDDDDRAVIDRELFAIYDAFKRVVAAGRRKSLDEVEALAQGRVWSGRDALERGLVDRLGGFEEALSAMRERLGPAGKLVQPHILSPPRRGMTPLNPPARHAAALSQVLTAFAGVDLSAATLACTGERALLWSPEAASIVT